jgi:hypothetical protein
LLALHSIRTLSKETGLHPKRLRKLLEAAGLLSEGSDDHVDGNCLFDAQRGSTLAAQAKAAIAGVVSGRYSAWMARQKSSDDSPGELIVHRRNCYKRGLFDVCLSG